MYSNYRWCKMVVDDKIADMRREASYDRLVLTTESGRRHPRPHLLIRLRQTLVSTLEGLRAVL